MKKGLFSAAVLASLLVAVIPIAVHAVPQNLNYQFYLSEADGAPVTTAVTVRIALYAVPSGGTALWTRTSSETPTQGLLSLSLGDAGNVLPANLFDTPVYLGVKVGADAEMAPRRALASTAFAFEADNAAALQGQTVSSLDQSADVAALDSRLAAAEANLASALTIISILQAAAANATANIAGNAAQIATVENDLVFTQADVTTLQANLAGANATIAQLNGAVAQAQSTITSLQGNSVLALDGVLTLEGSTARFDSVNLQVVNGSGASTTVNGLGNLLVGYDEPDTGPVLFSCSLGGFDTQGDCQSGGGVWANQHKSGSHNLVVGNGHRYSRSRSLIAGEAHIVNGDAASAIGGSHNRAAGAGASVTGGTSNIASGDAATVSGGTSNTASGIHASVAGGDGNVAFGTFSSVIGGQLNIAGDPDLADSGLGSAATVVGGFDNVASGLTSAVLGGTENAATGTDATVSGGQGNTASGDQSAVSGGNNRSATSQHDWAAGSLLEGS